LPGVAALPEKMGEGALVRGRTLRGSSTTEAPYTYKYIYRGVLLSI